MKMSLPARALCPFFYTLVFFILFLLPLTNIAQTYSDNASSYGGSWASGSNNSNSCANVGLGNWTITYGANTGSFTANPADDGMGTTGIGTSAFGLYATGSEYCNASRSIIGGMQVGDAFSFYWAINFDAGGGSKGFDFKNGGTTVFNVNNTGSATITTSNGTAFTSYGTTPMLVTLTRTSATAYSFSMTARDGGATYSTTINNSASVDGINFYIGNQNDGAYQKNMYLNAFQLTKPRYRSSASGNWGDAAVWEISTNGGSSWSAASAAPAGTFDAITVRNGHSITLNTTASAGSLTIDAGGTFNNGTARTLTMAACNATIVNNGIFNRNTGTISFSSTGTVTGAVGFHNLSVAGGLTLGSGLSASTVNGTLTLNSGGFIAAASPKYASGSLLVYNTGGTFNRGSEWPSGNTVETVPHHVTVNNGTTLNLDIKNDAADLTRYDGEGRTMLGDLDIYGTLTMGGDVSDGGSMAEDLNVGGGVTIRSTGSLTLGCQKPSEFKIGDILLGANWMHETGGVFNPARRGVWFNGNNAEQTVTYSGTEAFAYFIVNKPNNGTVKMFCNSRVYGTNQGSLFQILDGNLDLNGNTMTLETYDVIRLVELNILIDGSGGSLVRNIMNTSATPSTFKITHTNSSQRVTRVLRNSANAATLSFGTNVVVVLEGSATGNMGVNFGNAITTVHGTLQINPRSYVDVYPPTYATNSLLKYNTGGNYSRNAEWNAASGPGFPYNVQTSTAGTFLVAGGTSNTALALNMAGSLTVDAGTNFDMTNANANNMTVPLTVGYDINIAGTLTASQSAGGDIILGQHWTRSTGGVFTPYARSVTFNDSRNATLTAPTGGETFYDLVINKLGTGTIGTNYVGYKVTLNSPAVITNNVTLTSGVFVTTAANLMTVSAGASATGGGVETFVSGPMRKLGSTAFTFPVGKITNGGALEQFHYRPIAISNLGASADYTTEFFRVNPYTQGQISQLAKDAGLQLISYCEYWDLTRTTGSNTITVTPSWSTHGTWSSSCNVASYVMNTTALVVVPFNGTNPLPGTSQWGDADFGQNSIGTGNQSYIQTISWNGAVNYNKFVLGSINWRLAPLPYEIKDFKAFGKDKQVQLSWLINNNDEVRHYVIERSHNGMQFESLKHITARNNESLSSYTDLDPVPFNGWGYYRLRITDLQGTVTYSNIQKVWMGQVQTTLQLSPNPARDRLLIHIAEPEKVTELSIVNGIGQLLLKQNRLTTTNQLNIASLQPGVYYVRIVGQAGITTEMFVKE
jgi:hypothetical protein